MRTEINFHMKKDFFVMMTESKGDKFITSTAMGVPLTEETFFDSKTGTSEFIRFYSSNTYRTVTERPGKKSELSNQKMKTITWDFFEHQNGNFLAQLIAFISVDSRELLSEQWLETFKENINNVMENILVSYISKKNYDVRAHAERFFLSVDDRSVTFIFTMLRPELIESQVPKDCDVFLENEKLNFLDLRKANKCYVITAENKLKLVIREQETQEIKCPRIMELRNRLLKLKLQGEDGFFPFKEREKVLEIILRFLSAEVKSNTIQSQKGESAYSTMVITSHKSKHCISVKKSTGPGSWISKPISLATIQHYRKDDIIQIESQADLLAEKKTIDLVDEESKQKFPKDEKYFERLYPIRLKSKLLANAEEERRKIYESWIQNSTNKIWLSVISRLLVFQMHLQASNFKPELQPEDPIYERLREASLDYFWSFAKALKMTEIDESDVIPEESLGEIKKLWEIESKDHKLGWFEAFKQRYPKAPLHNGKEIGVLTVMPFNHVCKIRNFSALPISTEVSKQLKTFNYQVSRDKNSIIFSEVPSISIQEAQLTLDTIREFHYIEEGNFRAKLTVLYSPRFIEEKGWQQHMKNTCDLVLSSIAKEIFDNLSLFRKDNENKEDLSDFFTSVLSQETYNKVKASILLCLTVPQSSGTRRYLVGIGNCLALSFKNEQCTAIIGARYSEKGVPVLLDSLNKPDDPKALLFPSTRVHKQDSLQIAVINDSKQDIFLISGRAVELGFLKPNLTFKSKLNFKEYDLDIGKLLTGTEDKDQKMVDNVINALRKKRRKFLGSIEDPSMISAWKKIENLLRGQQFKSVEEKFKSVEEKLKKLKETEPDQVQIEEESDEEEIEKDPQLEKYYLWVKKRSNEKEIEEAEEGEEKIEKGPQFYLQEFYSEAKKVNECTTATDFIIALQLFSARYEIKNDPELSQKESLMVERLWSIAEIEAKGFPDSKQTEQVILTWTQVRGKYFLYFQGVKDLIAITNPSLSVSCQVDLFQHINAFAEQAVYPLQSTGKIQEALEVQTFKQIICAIGNDNSKIYKVLYQKLEFLDWQSSAIFGLSEFWKDLVTLLVATKLIRNPGLSQNDSVYSEDYEVQNVIEDLSKMLGLPSRISHFAAITLLPPPVKTKGDDPRTISEKTPESKQEFHF